jgi:hypothetical protein
LDWNWTRIGAEETKLVKGMGETYGMRRPAGRPAAAGETVLLGSVNGNENVGGKDFGG